MVAVDYSLPVAKRTRLGLAQALKEKNNGVNGSKGSTPLSKGKKPDSYGKRAIGSKKRNYVVDVADYELMISPGKQSSGSKKVEETPMGFNGDDDEDEGVVFISETKREYPRRPQIDLASDKSDNGSEQRKGCGLESGTRSDQESENVDVAVVSDREKSDHGSEQSKGCGFDSGTRSDQESEDVVVVVVSDHEKSDHGSEQSKGCGLVSDTRSDHESKQSKGCGLDSDSRSDQESEDVVVVVSDGDEGYSGDDSDESDSGYVSDLTETSSEHGGHRTDDDDFVPETEHLSPTPDGAKEGAQKEADLDENVEKGAKIGVKRKLGLDIFFKEENDGVGGTSWPTSISQRTRSKFKRNELKSSLVNPISLEERKKEGSSSSPMVYGNGGVDGEEMESSYYSSEDDDNGDIGRRRKKSKEDCAESENVGLNDDAEGEVCKEKKRRGRPRLEKASVCESSNDGGVGEGKDSVGKKRRGRPLNLFGLLEKSLWDEDGNSSLEKLFPCPRRDLETPLPGKFTFGIEEEDSVPSAKSEYDDHLDNLWSELEFGLRCSEIGSTPMVENDDAVCPDIELGTATCCRRGDHQFVLDEEIGVVCKICSFVKEEIKHIVPDFSTRPRWKRDWRDYDYMQRPNFDELRFEDSDADSCSGLDPIPHAKETVWDLVPGIKNSLYPHQQKGIEFIWKNIAGGIRLDELPKSDSPSSGNGCIISHAPGTGKTRLTIVFLQTYMRLYKTCRPVIIAPLGMLLTWEEEFRKWNFGIPFHNLNEGKLSECGEENKLAIKLLKYRSQFDKDSTRLAKLHCWKKSSSILGISYELLGSLCKKDGKKSDTIRKILLEIPDLIVFDEGHIPRNDNTMIWLATSMIQTRKRIVLSGTPFQNNFDELLNTICLARPEFPDKLLSKNSRELKKKPGLAKREAKKKWNSMTCCIGKGFDDKAKTEVQRMINPFVHVHRGSILSKSLPGLRDSVVILQPGHLQKTLLDLVMGARRTFQTISWENLICWGSIHPALLAQDDLYNRNEFSDYRGQLELLKLDYEAGVKTKFVWELIRLSMALKEKVLVFSQFLGPLQLMMDQLKHHFGWVEGKEVLKMDGKTDERQRQASMNFFNDPDSEAQVLLASTKACCVGINLVGASRVVLLDVVWNPSVEKQAISRAYRIGQKRVVHVYHLLTSGTMEFDKYRRQTMKDKIFDLVFSPSTSHTDSVQTTNLDDRILEEMMHHETFRNVFQIYSSKQSNLAEKDHHMVL